VRFLWGQGEIRDTFNVKPCAESCEVGESGDIVLELWPKKEIPTVHHSLLVIESGTYRVRRSIVFDALGNRTEYHFTDVHFGGKIADKRFAFVVPKGASILRSSVGDQPKTH
jgi:outer membrane lipoprotein-sorting protein